MRLSNETGTGEMCCYNLIEGFTLSYNNLSMGTSYQNIKIVKELLRLTIVWKDVMNLN